MAIDTTRGLPSFSEMYNAYKNQGSIGDAIKAGTEGFTSARAAKAKSTLEAANANEANAHADYYKSQAAGGTEKRIPLAALPEGAKAALGQYADANGSVTESQAKIYLANTAQGAASEKATNELNLRTQALEQQTKHQQEMAAVNQQLADLKAALGQSGQELSAAQTVANTTKGAAPSLAEKGMGLAGTLVSKMGAPKLGEMITPDEVIKAQQNAEAVSKLSGIAKMSHEIPPRDRGVTPPTAEMIAPPPPQKVYPLARNAKGTRTSPAPVNSREDYDALPVGAWFVDSTGKPTQKKQGQ